MPNLVGIGNSQVPTNAMLGGLAYQDDVDIEKIAAIKAKLSETAVDIFVYDTRKDSDGGAWRKRTQHTSWYNETLGTDVRGTRKEFPAVAVLVVRDVNPAYGLTIYDGDDPNLPMWMDYPKDSGQDPFFDYSDRGSTHIGNYSPTSVSALNGIICVGTYRSAGYITNLNAGIRQFRFIEDECYATNNDKTVKFPTRIADRTVATKEYYEHSNNKIVHVNVLDVAMTVLPNAPISNSSGLPRPTIAVATEGGVSVIKPSGYFNETIVDITSGTIIHHEPRNIDFFGTRLLWTEGNNYDLQDRVYLNAEVPTSDTVLPHTGALPSGYIGYGIGRGATNIFNNCSLFTSLNNEFPSPRERKYCISGSTDTIVLGCKHGVHGGIEQIYQNTTSPDQGSIVTLASSYNSGWKYGDCRGAFLTETDTTDATRTNLFTTDAFFSGDGSDTSDWNASSVTLSVNNGKLKILTSSQGYAWRSFTTVAGKQYVFTAAFASDGNASCWIQVGNSTHGNSGANIINANPIGEGKTIGFNFIATSTTTYLSLKVSTSGSNKDIQFYDISVSEAVRDRSYIGDGLEIRGTVPRQAVATNTELVSYGPFSTSNYLYQPINNSSYTQLSEHRTYGTGNMYYMAWIYCTSYSAVQVLACLFNGANSNGVRTAWHIHTDGKLKLYDQENSNTSAGGSSTSIRLNAWNHVVSIRQSDNNLRSYINGKESTASHTTRNLNQNDMALLVGADRWNNGSSPITGATHTKMALFRIGKGSPTAEVVRKIYDDEKKLFVPNAKCTLYGSSDAVTAIAYDDSTDTVHAGTSSGRSEFSGLNRINNTTTVVDTAISASNGLVAEQ